MPAILTAFLHRLSVMIRNSNATINCILLLRPNQCSHFRIHINFDQPSNVSGSFPWKMENRGIFGPLFIKSHSKFLLFFTFWKTSLRRSSTKFSSLKQGVVKYFYLLIFHCGNFSRPLKLLPYSLQRLGVRRSLSNGGKVMWEDTSRKTLWSQTVTFPNLTMLTGNLLRTDKIRVNTLWTWF